jgi:hypothetical protein
MHWMGPGSVVLLGALVLAGCGDDRPPPEEPDALSAGDEYVALGDSYTAAPGTGPPTSNDGCLQSALNYPHLVAEELDLELVDVSCGGATTADLTGGQEAPPKPPQLDALSEQTRLVTVRIGGNDSDLFSRTVYRCQELSDRGDGSPCADEFGGEGYLTETTDTIHDDLVAVLDEIEQRAPDARVVVVGYPEWAPPSPPESCPELPLATGDYAFARRGNELLVSALKTAATDADVEYVDVWSATQGHHICADDPWIAGLEPTGPAAPLHPYRAEQRTVADLLLDHLGVEPPEESDGAS